MVDAGIKNGPVLVDLGDHAAEDAEILKRAEENQAIGQRFSEVIEADAKEEAGVSEEAYDYNAGTESPMTRAALLKKYGNKSNPSTLKRIVGWLGKGKKDKSVSSGKASELSKGKYAVIDEDRGAAR